MCHVVVNDVKKNPSNQTHVLVYFKNTSSSSYLITGEFDAAIGHFLFIKTDVSNLRFGVGAPRNQNLRLGFFSAKKHVSNSSAGLFFLKITDMTCI
jgi:hypothetical protein